MAADNLLLGDPTLSAALRTWHYDYIALRSKNRQHLFASGGHDNPPPG